MADISTYNNIISVFKDIQQRSYELKTFKVGDQWEEDANTVSYPMLVINPTGGFMERGDNGYSTFEISMDVIICDLVYKGEENETEVVSNTLQMIKDIIVQFNQHPYYNNSRFDIVGDLDFETFTERNDDEVTGWQVLMVLRTPVIDTFCGIPTADITNFSFDRPTCGTNGGAVGSCLCIKSVNSDNPVQISEANDHYTWSLKDNFITGIDPVLVDSTSGLAGDYSISLSQSFITASTAGTGLASTQGASPYLFANTANQSVVPSFGLNNQIPTTTIQSVILSGNDNLITNLSNASAIITGNNNTIDSSAYSNIAGGYNNQITNATWSTISGGVNNLVNKNAGFVGGGRNHINSGINSSIIGGLTNKIYGSLSTIVGGYINHIYNSTIATTILGGQGNKIKQNTNYSVISGGRTNTIDGSYNSLIGIGDTNVITGGGTTAHIHNSIMNGNNNTITNSKYSTIIGGKNNSTTDDYSFIGSGETNVIIGSSAANYNRNVIVGGGKNKINGGAYGEGNFIGGGGQCWRDRTIAGGNYITSTYCSTIVGGHKNKVLASSDFSFIGGGRENTIHPATNYANIMGGYKNVMGTITTSNFSTIGGGYGNLINGTTSTIGGGTGNNIGPSANSSSILGGDGNNIDDSDNANIGGGDSNSLDTSNHSNIGGGGNNNITSSIYSTIVGGNSNSITFGGRSTILGGTINLIDNTGDLFGNGVDNLIAAGNNNTINNISKYSSILGGGDNTITGSDYSSILGGQNNNTGGFDNVHILGSGITADKDDYAFVENLEVQGGNLELTSITPSTTNNVLTRDADNVVRVRENASFNGFMTFTDSVTTTSLTYLDLTKNYVIFQGSDLIGSPSQISFIMYMNAASAGGAVRIIDKTNGDALICEITGITSTSSNNIQTTTTITNIPTGPAKWAIQYRSATGATAKWRSCSIMFG